MNLMKSRIVVVMGMNVEMVVVDMNKKRRQNKQKSGEQSLVKWKHAFFVVVAPTANILF